MEEPERHYLHLVHATLLLTPPPREAASSEKERSLCPKGKKKLSPGDISWDAQKCMERDSQTGIAGERTPE